MPKHKSTNRYDELLEAHGARAAKPGEAPSERTPRAGKRSDAEYRQVSAYIRKDTHRRAKIALLEEEREFSDLVEELLRGWLKSRS